MQSIETAGIARQGPTNGHVLQKGVRRLRGPCNAPEIRFQRETSTFCDADRHRPTGCSVLPKAYQDFTAVYQTTG